MAEIDEHFMQLAIAEAEKARDLDEVPIGAVIVDANGGVLATAGNRTITNNDPTAHAEIVALRKAAREMGTWRLNDCVMAVTLEPCPMCAGALVNARLGRLIYGCADPKAGAVRTLYRLCEDDRLNHRVIVEDGVLAAECAELLGQSGLRCVAVSDLDSAHTASGNLQFDALVIDAAVLQPTLALALAGLHVAAGAPMLVIAPRPSEVDA